MTETTGEVTYYARQEGTAWIFTPAPDPREARIAELEAALREIGGIAVRDYGVMVPSRARLNTISDIAAHALMPSPEGDMAVTVEELDA